MLSNADIDGFLGRMGIRVIYAIPTAVFYFLVYLCRCMRRWYIAGRALNQASSRSYRESSHIQFTSHVFPPSAEKDCSIRDDLGEMSSHI